MAETIPGQSALAPLGLQARPWPEDAPVRLTEIAHTGKLLLKVG